MNAIYHSYFYSEIFKISFITKVNNFIFENKQHMISHDLNIIHIFMTKNYKVPLYRYICVQYFQN